MNSTPVLESYGNDSPGAAFRVTPPQVRIGRGEGNEVSLADPRASRIHCRVCRCGDDYVVEDLASRNGTFVNGARLGGPRVLRDGDTIRAGRSLLVYRAGPAATSFVSDAGTDWPRTRTVAGPTAGPGPRPTARRRSVRRFRLWFRLVGGTLAFGWQSRREEE